MEESLSHFTVSVTGQVESAKMGGCNNIYCRVGYTSGPDWRVVQGVEDGITQMATKGSAGVFVWNFPLDITFSSTNPFGWPQVVITVYGLDLLGRDVLRGCGAVHIPVGSGRFVRYIRLFAPVSSSGLASWVGKIMGQRPEYLDPKIVARGEGREVTRVRSHGIVKIVFNIVTKDTHVYGMTLPTAEKTFLPPRHRDEQF
eukprot:TRINITY_DN33973_c0_g1_i1.p1 TRINITY_DN33973_c0_g1~~TRINITY_DN33973_c0_g1_i1.p1  ORF type:complete len:200 (+),score=23.86 TRINITY_DN33973_c0_g1_i1:61-660(+)